MSFERHVTIRQLRAFEAIAERQSFTAAAESLHVTQPTLSMQIKKLTDAAGVPLFEQVGKKIYLTEAGRELLVSSREIFGQIAHFEAVVANLKGVKQGTLRFAAVTTTEYFAPRILGEFTRRYPGIKVVLQLINREILLQRLDLNADDMYVMDQPPKDMDVEAIPFIKNPLEVIANPRHPLAKRRRISLQELLADEKMILRETGSGTRMALERYFKTHGVELKSSLELGSNEAIKQAVGVGLGVAILSRYALSHELSHGELAILPVAGFPLMQSWYVVYPKGKHLSIVARTFLDFLLQEGPQVVAAGLYNEAQ